MNDTPIQPIHEAAGIRAYDLALPVQPLVPAWTPLRYDPAEMAANAVRAQAERRAVQQRVAQETEAALAEWQALRDRNADNPIAVAVLDLHQPEAGYDRVICGECRDSDTHDGTIGVEWPCATYTAMKEAADVR